jgi:hypothetical protein
VLDPVDRSTWPVRKIRLSEEGASLDPAILAMTPEQRVAMVRQLTMQAWAFKEGRLDGPRVRRDVVRTIRSGR